MTCTQIKLYGERNTGTNYLDEVLALNFDAERLRGGAPAEINKQKRPQAAKEALRDEHDAATYAVTLGWKHREVDPDSLARLAPPGGSIFVVTLTKNPYSWLLSLKKRPYHYRGDKK